MQVVVYHEHGNPLEHGPCDASGHGPGDQIPRRHASGREDPEAGQVEADVDQRGDRGGEHCGHHQIGAVGDQAGKEGAAQHAQPEHGEERHRPAQPRHIPGPGRPGQVPHMHHGEQAGLCQAGRPPGRDEQADDDAGRTGPPQRMDVAYQCGADQRELPGYRVQHRVPHRRGARGDRDQRRDQDHQQRKHRDKGGMSQVGGQHAAVVVAVLLDHAEGERGNPVLLLSGVHPADHPLDRVHAQCAARQSRSQTGRGACGARPGG